MQYYQQWLLMKRLVRTKIKLQLHVTHKNYLGKKNPDRMCTFLARTSLKDYEGMQHSVIEWLALRR